MSLTLAPGVTFCESAGRRIFLDLPRDRYFCLAGEADRAFGALVSGEAWSAEHSDRLEPLRRDGILCCAGTAERPQPCRPCPIRLSPLDDDDPPRLPPLGVARAALRLARAKRALSRRPLHLLCAEIAAAKAGLGDRRPDPDPADLMRLAFAFHASSRIVGALDQCLAVSLAMARRAIERGFAADLCLGVRLRPFQAHAWVTVDGMLISDRGHVVRQFTPILIL